MPMTQAEVDALNAQVVALDQALASGELVVRHGSKEVQYQSADDILARITAIRRMLARQANPSAPVVRAALADFSDC
ncbi:MAG TPA: hypothetical protein VGE96_00850 [Steroidobacteraceae bacterium]|jgi:hypothetical protein